MTARYPEIRTTVIASTQSGLSLYLKPWSPADDDAADAIESVLREHDLAVLEVDAFLQNPQVIAAAGLDHARANALAMRTVVNEEGDVDLLLYEVGAGQLDSSELGSDIEEVTWTNSSGAAMPLALEVRVYSNDSGCTQPYDLDLTIQ